MMFHVSFWRIMRNVFLWYVVAWRKSMAGFFSHLRFFPAYEDYETSHNARREEMPLFRISCRWRCDRIRVATERYRSRRRVFEFIWCEWRSCHIPWRYGYECSQQSSEQGTTKIVGLLCFDLILQISDIVVFLPSL